MKSLFVLMVLVFTISGCARVVPMTLPDGDAGFVVKCAGDGTKCYERATTTCPSGYSIIDKTSGTSESYTTYDPYSGEQYHAPSARHTMLIKCK